MKRNSKRDFDAAGENALEGLGLTVGEMRGVARRQLAASLVVGVLVLAVGAVLALRPGHFDERSYRSAHSRVQQPAFVAPSDHVIAATKHRIETP